MFRKAPSWSLGTLVTQQEAVFGADLRRHPEGRQVWGGDGVVSLPLSLPGMTGSQPEERGAGWEAPSPGVPAGRQPVA